MYQIWVALANSQIVPGTKGDREPSSPHPRSPTSFFSRTGAWEGFELTTQKRDWRGGTEADSLGDREFYFLFWGKLFRKRRSELDTGTGKVRSPDLQCLLLRTSSLVNLLFSHLQKGEHLRKTPLRPC